MSGITLTEDQTSALEALRDFTKDKNADVFILKGSAGTGKTTLVGEYIKWCRANEFTISVHATTGRAAKILGDKTKVKCTTIHSLIYTFDAIDGLAPGQEDPFTSPSGQIFLNFGIRSIEEEKMAHVYLIDEASMIGTGESKGIKSANYGSGNLLKDIFSCTQGSKIVFVGDPCQLPPVETSAFSAALHEEYLRTTFHKRVRSQQLIRIMRQAETNEIIQLASKYRDDIVASRFVKYPKINCFSKINIHTLPDGESFVKIFAEKYRTYGNKEMIMISHSHSLVTQANRLIRKHLGLPETITAGDVLLIVQNNPISSLMNGDLVEVVQIHGTEERYPFHFLKVTVRNIANNEEHIQLLITELLYNNKSNLDPTDNQQLIIDFDRRMNTRGIERNSDRFKELLMTDPYANALRAKFGYAITCHKSQGGEWKYVFLLMDDRTYGMRGEALYRWLYTAVTRTSEHLVVNHSWWIA